MEIEEIKTIKEKVHEYEVKQDFQPLKISFEMSTPIFLTHPWINFDGLIAHLCLRDALEDMYYNLPSKIPIDFQDILSLPLKKSHDFYHSSISFFDTDKLFVETIYKRFDDVHTQYLKKRHKQGKIRRGSGPFRDFAIKIPYIPSQKIFFHVNGDREELERLLEHVIFLGKKPAIGGGMIKSRMIEEEEEDHSIMKDGKIMRPIPVKYAPISGKQMMLAYKPPYWDKRNIALCAVPHYLGE